MVTLFFLAEMVIMVMIMNQDGTIKVSGCRKSKTDDEQMCYSTWVESAGVSLDQYEKSSRPVYTRRLPSLLPTCDCCWKTVTGSTARIIPSRVKPSASRHCSNRSWLFFRGSLSIIFLFSSKKMHIVFQYIFLILFKVFFTTLTQCLVTGRTLILRKSMLFQSVKVLPF